MTIKNRPSSLYDPALRDIYAIKALYTGEATPEQQKHALTVIFNGIAGVTNSTYFPDSVRDSDFACGKRHVGQQIIGIIELTPDQVDKFKQLELKKGQKR